MFSLKSPVSGLQQLFSTALSPRSPRGQRQLESVTEEAHTYDLLYPDGDTLRQGQHHVNPLRHGDPSSAAAAASSSDDRGGLEIQSPRDIRIIIAQDANALSSQPRVLYDSHPSPPVHHGRNALSPEGTRNSSRRGDSLTSGETRRNSVQKSNTAPHSRQSVISQTAQSIFASPTSPLSPVSELGGLFGGSSGRRSATGRPVTSDGETAQGKIARESREETDALLECMFGATGFQSASSTKLHVRPPRSSGSGNEGTPNLVKKDMPSPGAFPKRRTPLTRSTTAADLQSLSSAVEVGETALQPPRPSSSSILLTRLFSVDPKEMALGTPKSGDSLLPQDQRRSGNNLTISERPGNIVNKFKAKQVKTPTYAVAAILQMPGHRQRPPTPSLQSFSPQGPRLNTMGYAAINTQTWSVEAAQVNGIEADPYRDIEYVIAHWTILIRALASLEVVGRCVISDSLARFEIPYPRPRPNEPSKPSSDWAPSSKPKKPKPSMQVTLQLPAGALQQNPIIKKMAEATGRRIASALKIRRVIAGQGRWGVWREEARWVGKWAGGRDQNFFFFNLLTAFLGSHTEWLDSLCPSRYRRRHTKSSSDVHSDVSSIPHRTVIVSLDKMAARRLVFLLSAFLPGVNMILSSGMPHQSDASWSNLGHSQSPPSGFPIHRRRSLRRTMNKRVADRSADGGVSHTRSISFTGSDGAVRDDATVEGQSISQRSRRASDARSIRSAALPVSSSTSATRKSSTTTTATIVVPIPHLATDPSVGTAAEPKPGSCGTLASLSLQRTLSRSESNEHGHASSDSTSATRWGSMMSGFWSNRRGSSTEDSDVLASSEEGLGISCVAKDLRSRCSTKKLSQMVEEVDVDGQAERPIQDETAAFSSPTSPKHLQFLSQGIDKPSPPKNIPERAEIEPLPLELSIDEEDGIVDVELPPSNSYSSSFASTMSSSAAIPTAASSFNDRFTLHGRTPVQYSQNTGSEPSVDVVGWLRSYHQDFALQAVRPYDRLKEDIKRSMRTEPTPTVAAVTPKGGTNDWTEVCTTLIADATNFSITRLSLKRRNAASPYHYANALFEDVARDVEEDERIVEDPIMDMDPILIEAVERVLAQSGPSSQAPSRATSPSRHTPTEGSSGLEIPRSECKKMVLGALEQVARSVSVELSRSKGAKDVKGTEREREVLNDGTLREGIRKWLNEVGKEGM